MLKAQSKNLLFFNDLVHHSRFVFFCIFIHGNDAGLHGARAERELDDIVHLHIVGSAGNLAVDDDSPASQASFATVRRLIMRETFKYLSSLMFKLLFFNIWRQRL